MLWWIYTNNFCQWKYRCSLLLPGCWCSPGHQQEIRKWWDIHWKRWKGTKTCAWYDLNLGRCFLFRVYRPLELAAVKIVDHKSSMVWKDLKSSEGSLSSGWISTDLWSSVNRTPAPKPSSPRPQAFLAMPPSLLQGCVLAGAIQRVTWYFNSPIYFSSLL